MVVPGRPRAKRLPDTEGGVWNNSMGFAAPAPGPKNRFTREGFLRKGRPYQTFSRKGRPHQTFLRKGRPSRLKRRMAICQGSGLRRRVGNAKIKTVFNWCNRFFSPGPYDVATKNAHFFWRFLRAFSIQNLDMCTVPTYSKCHWCDRSSVWKGLVFRSIYIEGTLSQYSQHLQWCRCLYSMQISCS